MQDLIRATREARSALLAAEHLLLRNLEELRAGGDVVDLLKLTSAHEQRELTNGALANFATLRRGLRLLAIKECVAQGMTTREVSDLWGFSRQRAATLINESRQTKRPGQMDSATDSYTSSSSTSTGLPSQNVDTHP